MCVYENAGSTTDVRALCTIVTQYKHTTYNVSVNLIVHTIITA